MTYPIQLKVSFDFSSGPSFAPPFVIGISTIGSARLATSGESTQVADLTPDTVAINIRRGRDLNQDRFNAGICTVRVLDDAGVWNPQNPSSPYYGLLQPLRKLTVVAVYNGVNYPLFAGYTTAYNYTYAKNEAISYVDIQCSDAFTLFNKSAITTVTGATAGETSGSRINDILNTIGFPSPQRNIDTGNINVQNDPGTLRTVLQALQDVEFTEYGALYIDPNGDVIFRQRQDLVDSTVQTPRVFNQTTGIPYKDLKLAFNDQLIFNVANFKREGGTTQTAIDQASIDTYFPHAITKENLLHQSDAETLDLARTYVANRSVTDIRIDSMILDLTTPNYAAGIQAALSTDFLDPVTITSDQPGGSSITRNLQVFGIQHQITPRSWITTFNTSDPILEGFVLDNPIYGIIGTSKL